MRTSTFIVDRKNLHQTRWQEAERTPLADGQVRMRVASFALTANNITYAAFGDAMNYWSFFPTGDAATGCIPVWGFADVAESRAGDMGVGVGAGLSVGERVYGYWPVANEVVLQPGRICWR